MKHFFNLFRYSFFNNIPMAFREILNLMVRQLSAGSFLQNLAFYSLIILFIGMVSSQFRQHPHKYKVSE